MNRPSPILQALLLSVGATATSYRIFHNLAISVAVGCGLGVLSAVALMADERRREAERYALLQEYERKQKAQAEKSTE